MPEEIELSEREREILRLVATGASNKEIAYKLVISPNTVKVHLRNIFAKVGVASRTEATLYAIRSGLLPAPVAAVTAPTGTPEAETLDEEAPGESLDETAAGETGPGPAADSAVLEPLPEKGRRGWLLRVALVLAVVALAALGILLWDESAQTPTLPTEAPAAAQPRWSARAELPEAVQDLAGTVYASQIYITGGESEAGISGHTWRYNPSTDSWTACADKPTPVSQASAALVGEKIYVPGGNNRDGQPTQVVEVYDPRADTWEQAAPLPEARSGYALAAFEGRLYLFGGWDGTQAASSVFVYDREQNAWETRSAMPTARYSMSAAAVSGKILVMGGLNGNALDKVEAYYPSRDVAGETAWESLPSMPQPRLATGVAVIADMVYLVGGEDAEGDESLPGLQFAPATGQWSTFTTPPNPPGERLLLLPLDTYLHILGGRLPGGASGQHQVYQAIYNLVFPVIQ